MGALGLLSVALPHVLAAQASTLRLGVRDTSSRAVDPGAVATVAYIVTNGSRAPVAARAVAELPARWRSITGDGPFTVAPSSGELRLASFAVPHDAAAGVYQVAFVVSPTGSGEPARAVATVRVRARQRLAVAGRDAPPPVVQGDRFGVEFVATNLGNAMSVVQARVSGSNGLALTVDSAVIAIAPGESRVVRVRGRADTARIGDGGARIVQLRVRSAAATPSDTAAWASATVTITVLPSPTEDLVARVPTALTFRGGRTEGGGPASMRGVEWSGSGAVADGSEMRVDFVARWSTLGVSPFGEQNEYRLRLTGPRVALGLGDQLFALSPLTAPGRYASGVGGRVDLGAWSIGAFADRSRWFTREGDERAAFVRVRRGGSEVGLHYLAHDGLRAGQAVSARLSVAAHARARVDAEFGSGLDATRGRAWRLAVSGDDPVVSYGLRIVSADSAFPGVVGGSREHSGFLTVRPFRAIRLETRYDARSTLPDHAFFASGPRAAVTRMLRLAAGDHVAARYRTDARSGQLFGLSQAIDERALEARVSGALGDTRVAASVEGGTFAERAAAPTTFRRGHVEASRAVGFRTALSGYARRTEGRSLYSWSGGSTTSLGVSADIGRGMATSGRLSTGVDVSGGLWPGRTSHLELEAEQELPHGHELLLRVRLPSRGGGWVAVAPATVQLDYRIPLGAPVGRKRGTGRFAVRVTDGQSGKGVPDVTLRVGTTRLVTDRDGRASATLLSGTHAFLVERTGTRSDLVPGEAPPSTVTVLGGRTTHVAVALVRSARVEGHVRRHAFVGSRFDEGRTGATADSGGVRGLTVTLTRDEEVIHRTTDADGRFVFEDVRPGHWRLRVSGPLPVDHMLEKADAELDLLPGSAHDATIRALPRHRRMLIKIEAELRAVPEPVSPGSSPRRPPPR